MSQYQHYRRIAPAAHHTPRSRRGLYVIVAVLLFAFYSVGSHQEQKVLADQPKSTVHSDSVSNQKPIDAAAIHQLIASDANDQIGVAVRNISSGKTDTYGVDAPFVAASTTKVLSAVTYYHLVENGKLRLDTKLGSFPAWFQIKQMIINSSNESWHLLSDEIGNTNLQAYATSIGMDFTQGRNTMSPSSMALLLAKLYKGELLNAKHTKTLLGYMRKTNNETLIPAALPKNYTTYHKYGDLDDELHDAAILVHGNTKYVLVIYTKGTGSTASRTSLIHGITKAIIKSYSL